MKARELISTFYNRFKQWYEACKAFIVAGFEDASTAVRQFIREVYAAVYYEKVNLVNRNIDHCENATRSLYEHQGYVTIT